MLRIKRIIVMVLTMILLTFFVTFSMSDVIPSYKTISFAEEFSLRDVETIDVKSVCGTISLTGYEVFRSDEKYDGYGKTPIFDTENYGYNNTSVEIGTRYYYKVRGYVETGGKRYYTQWSNIGYRKVSKNTTGKVKRFECERIPETEITITGNDLQDALDMVDIVLKTRLVKRTNGKPAVCVSWVTNQRDYYLTGIEKYKF